MMSRTDEPLEGVAFDVQDHTQRTGTRGLVHMGRWLVRTSMGLKSPSDGRWDGRGRTVVWRALAQRGRRTPSSGRFWHRLWPMVISPWQMDVDHDGQDATIDAGRFPGHVAALLGLFGTCGWFWSPRKGNVLIIWCLSCPKRANVSPKGAWRLDF